MIVIISSIAAALGSPSVITQLGTSGSYDKGYVVLIIKFLGDTEWWPSGLAKVNSVRASDSSANGRTVSAPAPLAASPAIPRSAK